MLADAPVVIPAHVLAQKMDQETVLLNAETGAYFGLTPVASRAWELLQQGHAPAALAPLLAREFDAPVEQIERDLTAFLARLTEKQLVQG